MRQSTCGWRSTLGAGTQHAQDLRLAILKRSVGTKGLALKDHGQTPHPGIAIHKIPVKGWVGLVFVVGIMLLFLVGLPQVRWFFLLSLPTGLLVGTVMYFIHRRRL